VHNGLRLSAEAEAVLRDLNPWWVTGEVRPVPPAYRRPLVADLGGRLRRPKGLVEVIRGPRQVGKTTGLQQVIQDLLAGGVRGEDVLFVRFDLELLREEPAALRSVVAWWVREVRRRPLDRGAAGYVLLDEIHKLRRWSEEVKHLGDTHPVRLVLTGSSSVLVARGGRESLAGRAFTTELPAFSFREVLEGWQPELASVLPQRIALGDVFEDALRGWTDALQRLGSRRRLALRGALGRYYARGGYPRLYGGEVDDERWADYLVQTVFENVLGADIPDLFPVENPALLRHLYLSVARQTGQEPSQVKLAQLATDAGIPANQPTVGKYLRYLGDALLIREFRRWPLARKATARVPSKITVSDLGVRNAIFRSAPSLWESDPTTLGPLVETLVQTVLRGPNLQVHFFREHEKPSDRRTPQREVDFVVERIDGTVLPVEIKFRRTVGREDVAGVAHFMRRFEAPLGVVVTRETAGWDAERRLLSVPLQDFLLAF
jgi:hypothetical protein